MTNFSITEAQIQSSFFGARPQTDISVAITRATEIAERGQCEMTVVRTWSNDVHIFSEYQMSVAKDEIMETVYSTTYGFIFSVAA
jgi:hypothetical protein